MIRKKKYVTVFVTGAIAGMLLLMHFAFDEHKEPDLKSGAISTSDNVWLTPPVPDQMNFANENVPLDRWDVYERFDRGIIV